MGRRNRKIKLEHSVTVEDICRDMGVSRNEAEIHTRVLVLANQVIALPDGRYTINPVRDTWKDITPDMISEASRNVSPIYK